MNIPNTDQFDRKFQELLSAGEELAGIGAVIDIQVERLRHYQRIGPSAAWPDRIEKTKCLLDYLYQQKEAAQSDVSCRLAGLEELL